MAQILGNLFNIRGRYIPRPPSFQELKRSINNDHPLIATLQNPMGSGHVVVVSGYRNPNKVIILDPMYGKHVVNYNTLIANFQYGYWTGSFLITPENSQNNSHGNRRRIPNNTRQPRAASQCVTNFGSCFMGVPIPIGSPCTCYTPRGPIHGVAR